MVYVLTLCQPLNITIHKYDSAKHTTLGPDPSVSKTDPDRLINLASNPQHKEVLSRMQKRVHALKTAYSKVQ